MVITLLLVTLAISITVEVVRNRRKRASERAQPSKEPVRESTQAGERFLHPGHSWVRVVNPRQTVVGVDELPPSFIGRLDGVSIPEVGVRVQQGGPLVTLLRGKRSITVLSPISGVIWDVNCRLKLDPALLNKSPLDQGWVARIDPENLEVECRNLLRGVQAVRWKESVLAQFRSLFSPRLGTVLQDGGNLIENLGETMGDDVWENLAQELFPLHSSGKPEIKSNQGTKS